MSATLRTLSLLSLLLFILGILASAYLLYNLPSDLVNTSALNPDDLSVVVPISSQLNFVIGLTFLVGVASVVLMILFDKGNTRENIVYVQAGKQETKSDLIKKNIGMEEEEEITLSDTSEFTHIINSDKNEKEKFDEVLSKLCMRIEASQGAIYKADYSEDVRKIKLVSSFAFTVAESESISFEFGEGLAGQAAKEQKQVLIGDIPEGYIKVFSGLGESSPKHLFITPLISDGKTLGVAEISSFVAFKKTEQDLIAAVFNALAKSMDGNEIKVMEEVEQQMEDNKPIDEDGEEPEDREG
ncbi:MAG: GAF domain-containing protein [Bacteroidota bacterium]